MLDVAALQPDLAHPDRYLSASLPSIPLPDGAVDVALCANFLFAYADTFDIAFHVTGIAELARIARSEVLIHPVNARDGRDLDDFVDAVQLGLFEAGLRAPGHSSRQARGFAARRPCGAALDAAVPCRPSRKV